MYYATHTVHDPYCNDGAQLFAFTTRTARDQFVKHGPHGCWSLVYPYEQKPISARDARKVARRDDFGDAYAYNGDAGGGVLYLWGTVNRDRFYNGMEA